VTGALKARQEAVMTDGERRIIEHLMTTNTTEMKDLPDWFLGVVERCDGEGPSRELITAA
jgi:hypothetical protein